MVALANLVVVPNDTDTVYDVSKPILVWVERAVYRRGYSPQHQFGERVLGVDDPHPHEFDGFHVGNDANTRWCCQLDQQRSSCERCPTRCRGRKRRENMERLRRNIRLQSAKQPMGGRSIVPANHGYGWRFGGRKALFDGGRSACVSAQLRLRLHPRQTLQPAHRAGLFRLD